MAENVAGLKSGELNAAQLFEPYAEELLHTGDAYMWYAAASRGPTAYTTLITRRATLVDKREEMLALTRAMATALRWVEETPGREVARAIAHFFPLVGEAILEGAIDRYRLVKVYAIDPVIPREGFDWLIGAMIKGGMLRGPIAFEDCVDNTLAREVSAELEPWTETRQTPLLGNDGKKRLPIRPPVTPRKTARARAAAKSDSATTT
jgi:NitT/TauT family transport system substrate-binding protein